MTKLKLELAQATGEILTREEQKRILGGAIGSGEDPCPGKISFNKCVKRSSNPDPNAPDDVMKEWTDTGCPKLEKFPCADDERHTCAC